MQRNQNHYQFGFTVVELLVVFVIMVMLSSLVVINWNKQKPTRSLVIAQNELITNIRKVQSYAVSSKNISTGSSAKYYLVKFNLNSASYTVEAIDSNGNMTGKSIEQINLPAGLNISLLRLVDDSGTAVEYSCISAIFSVIYGKTYFYGGKEISDTGCSAPEIEQLVADPVLLAKQGDTNMQLSMTHTQTGAVKSIQVSSQTGRVEATTIKVEGGGK